MVVCVWWASHVGVVQVIWVLALMWWASQVGVVGKSCGCGCGGQVKWVWGQVKQVWWVSQVDVGVMGNVGMCVGQVRQV